MQEPSHRGNGHNRSEARLGDEIVAICNEAIEDISAYGGLLGRTESSRMAARKRTLVARESEQDINVEVQRSWRQAKSKSRF